VSLVIELAIIVAIVWFVNKGMRNTPPVFDKPPASLKERDQRLTSLRREMAFHVVALTLLALFMVYTWNTTNADNLELAAQLVFLVPGGVWLCALQMPVRFWREIRQTERYPALY
jgi:hypothetical protein